MPVPGKICKQCRVCGKGGDSLREEAGMGSYSIVCFCHILQRMTGTERLIVSPKVTQV